MHTWVQYFEFFRSRKGWQNLFQNHEIPVRKKTQFVSKGILVPMSYITYYICIIYVYSIIYVLYVYYMCIICVLYMYYIICIRSAFAGFCWFFLGFWRPRRFLYVLLLAFLGFLASDAENKPARFWEPPYPPRVPSTTESQNWGDSGGNQKDSHSLMAPVGSADW